MASFQIHAWLMQAPPGLRLALGVALALALHFPRIDAQESDPCAALQASLASFAAENDVVLARPTDVLPCTQSVAFNARRDLRDLDSVIKYLKNFYGLIHIAKRAPDPRVPSQYDVIAKLRALNRTNWQTAEGFWSAVVRAVRKLEDGHTGLSPTCPPFVHYLPFQLTFFPKGGRPTVHVGPYAMQYSSFLEWSALPPFSFNASKYLEAQVLRIEGVPAWDFMLNFSRTQGMPAHNAGQQLNYAFSSFDYRLENPKTDYIEMTFLRNGTRETVNVPWITYLPNGFEDYFNSTEEYRASFCTAQAAASTSQQPVVHREHRRVPLPPQGNPIDGVPLDTSNPDQLQLFEDAVLQTELSDGLLALSTQFIDPRLKALENVAKRMQGSVQASQQIFSFGRVISNPYDTFKVWLLNDLTAVVDVNTFIDATVPNPTNRDVRRMFWDLFQALSLASSRGKRFIIDFRSNPGGWVMLGYWFIGLIAGYDKFPGMRKDGMIMPCRFLADTTLIPKYIANREDYFDCSDYKFPNGTDPLTGSKCADVFKPYERLSLTGMDPVGKYTSVIVQDFPSVEKAFGPKISGIFGEKPVLLLSNGECFSICHTVSYILNKQFNVPLVTVGGIPGQPMSFAAGGGGGFVWSDVEYSASQVLQPKYRVFPDAPRKFINSLQLALRVPVGVVSVRSRRALEFEYLRPQHRIFYTMEHRKDLTAFYRDVASFFSGN